MEHWTKRFPTRLEAEKRAFAEAAECNLELDDQVFSETSRVVFRGTLQRAGKQPVELEVRYPDSFPYLRPEVFAPALALERHQNPYRGNLCLLDRSTRHWSPSKTGAWLVTERVPHLLDLVEGGDPDEMRREESPQGEPASVYFGGTESTVVFIPDEMLQLPTDVVTGIARLSVGRSERGPGLRACLTRVEVESRRGGRRELARATPPLTARFSTTQYEARWVRLERFPLGGAGTGEDLLAAARSVPGFEMPPPHRVDGGQLRIVGVVCAEEIRQGEFEDAWLFAVEVRASEPEAQRGVYVVRGERLSEQDLAERIPTLQGLPDKTLALVGLGGIGAPIAFELARAQVGELRVMDQDHVEAGTIVRWPIGVTAVGRAKTEVARHWLPNEYPFTRVRSFTHHIGHVPARDEPEERSETETLTEFLDGADLLLDVTAEAGVQQLLSALADEAGITQIYAWATEGGWGGMVARVVPGETGCWYCLMLRIADGSIPAPPFAAGGTVQPRGCAAPTWTGSSFDALPIVAQAVRTACFTVLYGRVSQHDDPPNDVFRCAQPVEPAGSLVAPTWESFPLEPHPDCSCREGNNGA